MRLVSPDPSELPSLFSKVSKPKLKCFGCKIHALMEAQELQRRKGTGHKHLYTMFRSRLEILALLQTQWTNASGNTQSLSQLEYHRNQKVKYIHPTSSSSKPCNSLTFPNVKQKLEWIIICPLLSRNPTNPPCFQLVSSPSCQVPPAAVKPGQGLQIPNTASQISLSDAKTAVLMYTELNFCPI